MEEIYVEILNDTSKIPIKILYNNIIDIDELIELLEKQKKQGVMEILFDFKEDK